MHSKGKNRALAILFAVISVAVLGFAIYFGSYIVEHFVLLKVEKEGVELTATVTGFDSRISSNNVSYYYMTYTYEYEDEVCYGKTCESYLAEELIKVGETIQIKHYNGKSIEVGYSKKVDLSTYIIFTSVFAIGFVVLVILSVVNIRKNIIYNKLINSGERYRVKIHSDDVAYTTNGSPRYNIRYIIADNNGNERIVQAKGVFTKPQLSYLKSLDTIEVIYDGKQSIVVEDLHNNRINQALTYVPRKTTDTSIKKYECEYCGSVVEPDDSGKCPHCNHIIEEYLIRNK